MANGNIQPLKGFRDFLPEAQAERNKFFETVRSVFERYGFLPMGTPSLEYLSSLSGKYGADEKLLYKFQDQGGRDVALRYDLTVPMARYISNYMNELPIPFKRYQIDNVWRADKPQKGRYREFTQCDVDVVGSESMSADADVITCLASVLTEFGVNDFVVRLNNRKLLNSLLAESGVAKEKFVETIRILDKLGNIGEEEVRGELASLGIQTKEADQIFELISQDFQSAQDLVEKFEGLDGAGELAELLEKLLLSGVKNYQVDLTLARGLDYYTGTIFEIILPDAAEFGSVAGGGRYDNLLDKFVGRELPAVGGSIGVDRLLAALEELELLKYDQVTDVLVCNLDENLSEKYIRLAKMLRDSGIKIDLYYEPVKLERQLKYANKKDINFAVIVGADEDQKDIATVKNMLTGKQESVSTKDLPDFFKKL